MWKWSVTKNILCCLFKTCLDNVFVRMLRHLAFETHSRKLLKLTNKVYPIYVVWILVLIKNCKTQTLDAKN